MVESQVTCDNYRCHEYGSKMQRNVFYEDDDEMEYFSCNKCRNTTTPQIVEIEMGNCYMCDKPAVFIAHDLPTGEKSFCSELHYCQYAGAPYHGEGYYGFTDSAKVKEPARIARARKRLKYAESFSAEEKVKANEIVNNGRENRTSYSYKGHRGEFDWDVHREQKGLIKYKNNFKDGHMGEGDYLPHSNKFQTDKLLKSHAKHIFRLSLDRNCHTCKEPIHKKGIGRCDWCENDFDIGWGPSKFDDTYFYEDDWFNKLSLTQQDEYIHDLTNNNPYCRDCLYYYGAHKATYPNKFDREGANYGGGNAVCETHWDEIVAEGNLSKDSKRHSLYKIENVSPRERMMKQRFGLGAETFEADTNQWKVGDKVRIIGNSGGYHGFDIGEIVTLVIEYPINNGWWAMVNDDTPIKEQLVSLKDVELYVQPNTNPRKARLKKRFGLGAENEYVKTGVASLVVVSLLGFALFKRN